MSSLLQLYCDVTQSMAFKCSELNSNSSITSSNSKQFITNKLKCFSCYGITNNDDFCIHCGGTGYVTDTHPLAVLFNDVFQTKLNVKSTPKQSLWIDFEDVQTIREQQQQLDQRKIICDLCNKQCDINYKYFCQCCQCFFVCLKCADQKGDQIYHIHPLATNKRIPKPDLALKRTNSGQYNSYTSNNSHISTNNKNNDNFIRSHKQEHQLDYFNVIDIIDKDIKIMYQNVIQNTHQQQHQQNHMMDSLNPYKFRMLDSQGPNNMLTSNRLRKVIKDQNSVDMLSSIKKGSNMLNSINQAMIMTKNKTNIYEQDKFNQNNNMLKSKGSKPNKKNCCEISNNQICWQTRDKNLINQDNSQCDSILMQQSINPHHSRLLDGVGIQIRQSIDFTLYDNQSLCQSVGPRQSFGFGRQSIVMEMCNNCGLQLKDFYSVCRTCQKSKSNFKICCQCQDKKSYKHQKTHQMEMVLGNLLGRKSQMVSQSAIESDQQDQQLMSLKMTKKKSSLQKRPPRLPQSSFDDQFSDKKSFCKLKPAQSFGMSSIEPVTINIKNFTQESRINLDCDSLYNSTELRDQLETIQLVHKKSSLLDVNNSIENVPNLSRFNQRKQQKPRVGFVQNLYNDQEKIPIQYVESDQDSDQEESPKLKQIRKTIGQTSNRNSQKVIRSLKHLQSSQTEDKQISASSQQISSSIKCSRSSLKFTQKQYQRQYQSNIVDETPQVEEFIFHQYSCDECGCSPIKNVRYHCLECQDFDVCESCFDDGLDTRHCHDFQKIDGLKKMQDKKAMLLQRKDINKGRDSMLRSSNVGMLNKTKKTVELMKKSVNQLNSSISNISKSFGNYGDFLSQRMSIKSKVQFF